MSLKRKNFSCYYCNCSSFRWFLSKNNAKSFDLNVNNKTQSKKKERKKKNYVNYNGMGT